MASSTSRGSWATTAQRWIADEGSLASALRDLIGSGETQAVLQNDKSKDGWQLIEDQPEPAQAKPSSMELTQFSEEDQDLIGDEVVDRVKAMTGMLGQRHAEYLMDHQDEIPEDFQGFSLVFPGTIWLGTDSNHHVPCATFRRGVWELTFGILEGGLDSRDKLVRGA